MIWRIRSGWGVAALCLAALMASGLTTASARGVVKHRPRPAAVIEKDAAIIEDGASGRVLYSRNADAPRKPASLTKMMTLYLLFEELDEGNITLTSPMTASLHASLQSPTKLGLRPGEQIDVETAIKAITVLSANDVAVLIAETLGKTEEAFAKRMTEKARELGMTMTNFHNASGLPDPLQVTSARDMALLGRHLAYDFPQYFSYFSTPSFAYEGRVYDNHDHLLGAFDGVDGIKTGYTRASGFNLATSAVRNNKHIVGVVMGGMTYASRDHEMVRLLSSAFDFAEQNPTVLADANPPWRGGKGPVADPFNTRPDGANVMVASLNLDPPPAATPAPPKPAATAAAKPKPAISNVKKPVAKPVLVASAEPPKPEPSVTDKMPVVVAAAESEPSNSITLRLPLASAAGTIARIPFAPVPALETPSNLAIASAAPLPKERPASRVLQGDITGLSLLFGAARAETRHPAKQWTVQIGAFANETIAESELASYAQLSAGTLGRAERLVAPFASFDGHRLYRARFGPFAETEARTICSVMIKHGQQCFATSQFN
jgi:D-alanyl-D-alanine carboxypeptidase